MIRLFIFYVICILSYPMAMTQEIVLTGKGKISGISTEDRTIEIYKGIPFAEAPIGDLRWKAPRAAKKWKGIKKCEVFGPSPMQAKPVPFSMWSEEFLIPAEPISEDCLYLNVWTGSDKRLKRPVVVWIYGGGFVSGGSGVPIYDGEAMARKGVVFVSINYRVGIFGFFSHPDLTAESSNKSSGNYGLMDQIAALKWVQDNIAAFGGDPDNVTIAGQSAGSMSVNCLVASPQAKGLFKRAIAHSGASFSGKQLTLEEAEVAGQNMTIKSGINSLDQLRQLPADSLLKLQSSARGPIIDGYILPDQIINIFENGQENSVDLLTGWTQEEGLIFGEIKSAAEYKMQLKSQYPDYALSLLTYYPATNDKIAIQSQFDLARDMIFGAQNYTWANRQAAKGNTKTFVYRFTRKVPGTGDYAKYGAFHTGDIPYAYDNLKFVDRPWQQIDHQLAEIMSDYWINFIKTGNPNEQELIHWPEYQESTKKIMELGPDVASGKIPDKDALDLVYRIISQ
ncbi:MAG: carboxylesterase family protein [Saprospiraceae bacterium]|nr:carboxylesterase family protein [Saprospiraceae bacterium]